MEKYKKLIEKQRELINLLDESTENMKVSDSIKRIELFDEISVLEKEIEEDEDKIDETISLCIHPNDKRELYHDGATVCTQCNCIIAQNGRWFGENPTKLSML